MKEWICEEVPALTMDGKVVSTMLHQEHELVRCKDCKHGRQSDLSPKCIPESTHLIKCGLLEDDTDCDIVIYHKEDWFCANGERADNGN